MGAFQIKRARLRRLVAHTHFRFPHPRGIHHPAMEEGEHGTIGTALLLVDARLERLVRIFGSPARRRRQLLRGELFDQHIGAMDRPDDIPGRRWGMATARSSAQARSTTSARPSGTRTPSGPWAAIVDNTPP